MRLGNIEFNVEEADPDESEEVLEAIESLNEDDLMISSSKLIILEGKEK